VTKRDFILAGVGGQGTILAGHVLARVGMEAGYDVKKAEVHGMAQRGGSVVSHVRWAERVHSPLIPLHRADYLLAFEKLEALRWARFLKPEGTAVVADYRVPPLSVSLGQFAYPEDSRLEEVVGSHGRTVKLVPSVQIAQELGNARVNNVVMLGALSVLVAVDEAAWREVIGEAVPPRFHDLNLEAFDRGRAWGRSAFQA
jgi:indolepyruvate ferredoxin oxidoreductase beta subunit